MSSIRYLNYHSKMAIVILPIISSIFQIILVFFDIENPIRVMNGFLFLVIWPGFCLLLALRPLFHPKLGLLEHVTLAMPLSLAITTLAGLIINGIDIGIRPIYQTFAISTIIITSSVFGFNNKLPNYNWKRNRLVLLGMFIVILAFGWVSQPLPNNSDTREFVSLYILDESGRIFRDEINAQAGEPIHFIVGGEYKGDDPVNYILLSPTGDQFNLILQPGATWERQVEITLPEPGNYRLGWILVSRDTQPTERVVFVNILAH